MKEFGEKVRGAEYSRRPGGYGLLIEGALVGVVRPAGYETYFLVGGAVEPGETPVEALRREAKEEIGAEIETGEKIGEAVEYFYSEAEKAYVAKECHFYRVSLAGGKGEKQGEHELVWVTAEGLGRMHHQSHRWAAEAELKRA